MDMSAKLWDHFCWILALKREQQFCPIVILVTCFGEVYVINYIYIAMDIAKKGKLKLISEEFPTPEALVKAPPRLNGKIMWKFLNLMTNRSFRFTIWAIGNDNNTFLNTLEYCVLKFRIKL